MGNGERAQEESLGANLPQPALYPQSQCGSAGCGPGPKPSVNEDGKVSCEIIFSYLGFFKLFSFCRMNWALFNTLFGMSRTDVRLAVGKWGERRSAFVYSLFLTRFRFDWTQSCIMVFVGRTDFYFRAVTLSFLTFWFRHVSVIEREPCPYTRITYVFDDVN
jgi:hypothetical protein